MNSGVIRKWMPFGAGRPSLATPLGFSLSGREIDASQAERLGRLSIACSALSPHARLRRNATMSHAFSCMQLAFIDL
ncbi:hypothetical protein EVAR_95908_1 [Eumeta japonica]|uniref:Uncharacterized protein n=1 Tax=Eumeta variegata TaxID=151549 RepID=A0A4C1XIF7_EUMVA|nr:hypothetical protein EVAR_95908_1 [Eumeta japonica]